MNDNRISAVAESLARCERLKVLRLSHNRLKLEDLPLVILEKSNISLLTIEGNPLSMKALQELPEYAKVGRLRHFIKRSLPVILLGWYVLLLKHLRRPKGYRANNALPILH